MGKQGQRLKRNRKIENVHGEYIPWYWQVVGGLLWGGFITFITLIALEVI